MRGGGESFWHLQPRSGRKHVLASMSTARTARQMTDNIDHARLDAELFDLLQDPHAVDTLSAVLAENFRCAATGLRLVLPDGAAMVEAAHIHPFSEAGDDDPRNGLALTPDMHWALDRHLIAPDTDFRWRVSRALDRRIPDYQVLTGLEGKPLFWPREARMYPKREAIEWRLAMLDT